MDCGDAFIASSAKRQVARRLSSDKMAEHGNSLGARCSPKHRIDIDHRAPAAPVLG